MFRSLKQRQHFMLWALSFAGFCVIFAPSGFAASPQKTVEFGVLAKTVLVRAGSDKTDPSISYQAAWDQIDNPSFYAFKKKDFAESFQGTVKPLVVFNGKAAKEAYKKSSNVHWNATASGSRAGVAKMIFSAMINDGAEEEAIIASLKRSGIEAKKMVCDESNPSLDEYKTGIMFKVYKLMAKGYFPGTLIIAGDVAAQHIALDLSVVPNIKELSSTCK